MSFLNAHLVMRLTISQAWLILIRRRAVHE